MKKRLLAMLMALALLVSLMPMGVLAYGGQGNGGGGEPLSPSSVGNDDVTISKTAERTGEDTWKVTMTVTAKEQVQSEPLELVLLLDRSGSMAWCTHMEHGNYFGENHYYFRGGEWCNYEGEYSGTDSRQAIAGNAAKDLIDRLAEMGISASVSVVGFSGDDYDTHGVISQMTPLTTSNADSIKNSIPTRGAVGGTHMNDGLKMADDQFSPNATNKVIVLLADGDYDGTDPNGYRGYVNTLEGKGVVVHTIGFTTSNSTLQEIADTTGGKYYTADDAEDLAQAFNRIADDLTAMVEDDMGNDVEVVGDATADNGKVTVSGDGKLSWNPKDGKLEGGQTVTITYTVKLTDAAKADLQAGSNNVINLNGNAVLTYKVGDGNTQTLKFPLPTDTVQVGQLTTQVTLDGTEYSSTTGDKVIIYGDDDTFTWTEPEATIEVGDTTYTYSGSTYDGTATIETSVAAEAGRHTLVHNYVSKPTSTPTAHPITIQVVLDGNTNTDNIITGSGIDTYIDVEPYQNTSETGGTSWNPGRYENGTVTYSVTYYDCKDIGFSANRGYVIEAIDAQTVFGQSGSKGIYAIDDDNLAQYGEYMEYEGDTDIGYYVSGTTYSASDAKTDEPINPIGDEYEDIYYPVDCGCTGEEEHTGHTDVNGAQPGVENLFVVSGLDTDITFIKLPSDDDGAYTVAGWYVGQKGSSGNTYSDTHNVSEFVDSVGSDNVIKFNATKTKNQVTITINYKADDGTDLVKTSVTNSIDFGASYSYEVGSDEIPQKIIAVNGDNYTFDSVKSGALSSENVTSNVEITVVYSKDEIGPDDGPDDIPDKYQVTVNYVADEGGSITGITSEVLTIRDQNNNLVESGTVTASGSTAAAAANYAFDYWTLDDTRIDADATFSNYGMPVSGGQTYTFTAHFKANNPAIDITKTASVNGHTLTAGETVEVGDEITYTITVTNTGNVAFENLTVSDDMWGEDVKVEVKIGDVFYPANLAEDETNGYFLYIADEFNRPGEFKPGDTWTCRYTYKVVDTDAGETIKNTAVVDGETDGEDTVEITVNDPSVSINKTVTGYTDKAMEGDELTYTITVRNTGNTVIDEFTVEDNMWEHGMPIYVDGELAYVNSEDSYTVRTADLGPRDSITINYTYTVTAQDVANGKIDNAATADINGDGMPDAEHEVTTPTGYPSLTVEKTANASTVQVGTPITYTVEVKNDGYSVMNNVVISDTLWTSDTDIEATGNVTGEYDASNSKYYIEKLEPGEYVTLTYTYTPTEAGRLENKVTATSDGLDTVPEDSVIVEVTPEPTPDEPDISVTKTDDVAYNETVELGDVVEYRIVVKNTGNVDLTDVVVTDTLWEAGTVIYVGSERIELTGDSIKFESLPVDETITITYYYTVTRADEREGEIVNEVTVKAGDGTTDSDTETTPVDDGWTPKPDDDDDTVYVPNWLNTTDHYAYIVGYEDGTIRPQNNITRAEVATIFFRLLTDNARERYWSTTNDFSDVAAESWYNNAISTLSNMGIINGYEDGTFKPNAPITRAEFTAIATRFFDYEAEYDGAFNDVSARAWYADYVQAAVDMGLVDGYPDGGFHPDAYITRAEACTIVNRVLHRVPHEDHLLAESVMNTWPDNPKSAWYYEDMQEATNSHDYDWIRVDGETVEDWTKKLPERDWSALETEWATEYSR